MYIIYTFISDINIFRMLKIGKRTCCHVELVVKQTIILSGSLIK